MYTSYLKKKINQKWQNRLQLDKKMHFFVLIEPMVLEKV